MFSLREVFFQPLKCQPNINTLRLQRNPINGNQQIFLVGLDGFGVIVEYFPSAHEYKAFPIGSADAPSDCRVLSMEILPISKFNPTPAMIYGYARPTGISSSDEGTNFSFDRFQIVDNNAKPSSQTRSLSFAPKFLKVIATKNFVTNENETVLVVAGAEKVLFFTEKNERILQDVTKSIEQYLPELKLTSGNLSAMDVLSIFDDETHRIKRRLLVCGYATGLLELYSTEVANDGTIPTTAKTLEYDSLISSVKFFYHNYKPRKDEEPHLLVTGALEPAVVYRNVSTKFLSDPVVLPGTDCQDCLTCSAISDVDLDGKNEILLGTFGRICFVCRVPIENCETTSPVGLTFPSEVFPVCRALNLAASAFGIIAADLTQDGLDEIVIATTKGLHIYQLDLSEVAKLVESRLQKK